MDGSLCSDSQASSHETVSTLGDILLEKEILLESGTNELEALVFEVADFAFAINVAKVREVLTTPPITPLAKSHPSIRGAFSLRDRVIPCISLKTHLSAQSVASGSESHVILTEINQQQTAFLVDRVHHIHRISWENILPVPDLRSLVCCPVTALARCDDRLLLLLDFEKVLDDVTGGSTRMGKVENPDHVPRETMRILMVEDSPTVRDRVGTTLRASGYEQVLFFNNGAEAWQWLQERLAETDRLEDIAHLLISDVEMPQVDGFHLTKRVKDHPQLSQLSVLLYSSIITPDNYKKGIAVGADAQITKPELDRVVELADSLISGQGYGQAADTTAASQTGEVPHFDSSKDADSRPCASREDELRAGASHDSRATEPVVTPPAPARDHDNGERCPGEPDETCPSPDIDDVDMGTWTSFHNELASKVSTLGEVLQRDETGAWNETLQRTVARTLHSIKAAAQVIPVDPIVRRTHLVEDCLQSCHDDNRERLLETLEQHVDWLASLVQPHQALENPADAIPRFAARIRELVSE